MAAPQEVAQPLTIQEAVVAIQEGERPLNTAVALDPKKEEYFQYCDAVYPSDPYRHHIQYEKVYSFMCYQSFREKKKAGGKRSLLLVKL